MFLACLESSKTPQVSDPLADTACMGTVEGTDVMDSYTERIMRRGINAFAESMRSMPGNKLTVTGSFEWGRSFFGFGKQPTETLVVIAGRGHRALQVAELAEGPIEHDPSIGPIDNTSPEQMEAGHVKLINQSSKVAHRFMVKNDRNLLIMRAPDFEDPTTVVFARGAAAASLMERAKAAGFIN